MASTLDPAPHTRRNVKMRTSDLETAVMDRVDAGQSATAIARELGMNLRTVKCVIDYMGIGRSDRAMSRGTLARASDQLLAAIVRHHPEKIYP